MTLRELDIAMAERVMLWPRDDKNEMELTESFFSVYGSNERLSLFRRGWGYDHKSWSPAREHQDAFEVVERLRQAGVWTNIQIFSHTTQVRVEMGVPSSECGEWGETVTEAICKCALRAIEKFELLAERLRKLEASPTGESL